MIDAVLSQILTSDTFGIEFYFAKNNPKTLNDLIGKLKSYYKDKSNVDFYKMDYELLPSQAASSPDVKQMLSMGISYSNKFTILINGLGIVSHIGF